MSRKEKISTFYFSSSSLPLEQHRAKGFSFLGNTRILTQLSLLVAVGLILFLFESFLPHPVPWAKLGLANIATLLALYLFDLKTALIVVISRVILGSFLLGTTFNPAFLLSLFGGIISALTMGFFIKTCANVFSVVGISIIGASSHNLVQLFLVYILLVRKFEILYLVPVLLLTSVVTGFVVGLFVHFLLTRFIHSQAKIDPQHFQCTS